MYCPHCDGIYEEGEEYCPTCNWPLPIEDPDRGLCIPARKRKVDGWAIPSWAICGWIIGYFILFPLLAHMTNFHLSRFTVAAIPAGIGLLIGTLTIQRKFSHPLYLSVLKGHAEQCIVLAVIAGSYIFAVTILTVIGYGLWSDHLVWVYLGFSSFLGLLIGVGKKCRICAVLLFTGGILFSTLLALAEKDTGYKLGTVICLILYWFGVVGTFRYHAAEDLLSRLRITAIGQALTYLAPLPAGPEQPAVALEE